MMKMGIFILVPPGKIAGVGDKEGDIIEETTGKMEMLQSTYW